MGGRMYIKKMGQVFALQLAAFLISQPTYASWFGGSGFSSDSVREEKEKTLEKLDESDHEDDLTQIVANYFGLTE